MTGPSNCREAVLDVCPRREKGDMVEAQAPTLPAWACYLNSQMCTTIGLTSQACVW